MTFHGDTFSESPPVIQSAVLALLICFCVFGCDSLSPETSGEDAAVVLCKAKADTSFYRKEPIRPLVEPLDSSSEKVMLGRDLFHDVRLSHDNSISCASCHVIAEGGDDGFKTAVGIRGQLGALNTPTVFNCSLGIAQFWDGRAKTLAEQAEGPIHNPMEMGSDWGEIIGKLNKDAELVSRFQRLFSTDPTPNALIASLVAYEKALVTVDSPFDQYLKREAELSADALAGYQTFKSVGCVSCHQGQAVGGNMFQKFGIMRDFGDRFDAGRDANRGRIHATHRSVDLHRFKVPSLRNVTQTKPYFHDGSAETLTEAIETMAEFQLGTSLSQLETQQILAFLQSLTGNIPRHLK